MRRYRRRKLDRDPFVSRPRVVRRLLGATLVCALQVLIFYGVNYPEVLSERAIFLSYWAGVLSIVPVLLLLAFLDLRETHRIAVRELQATMRAAARALEQELAEWARKHGERPGNDPPSP